MHSRCVADKAAADRSCNIDAQFVATHPNEPRWDYVVERTRPGRSRTAAGIEVHPASSGNEVAALLAKMRWAKLVVAEHEPDLVVDAWHWVQTSNVAFKSTDRYGRPWRSPASACPAGRSSGSDGSA